MHVQRDKDAAAQNFLMDLCALIEDLRERHARENAAQFGAHFAFIRQAYRAVLQHIKHTHRRLSAQPLAQHGDLSRLGERDRRVNHFGERCIHVCHPVAPAVFDFGNQHLCIFGAFAEDVEFGLRVGGVFIFDQWQIAFEVTGEGIEQFEFVFAGQLNVDAFNRIGVLAHAWQWNHHVFIDFKRIGVSRDGRCAGAVEPEFLACFFGHCNKTFACARVRHAHDF